MIFKPGLHIKQRTFALRPMALGATQFIVPSTIDLRSQLLDSSDQGSSSKCVAYAMAGWLEFYRWKYFGDSRQVNPDPIYKRAKEMDGIDGEGTTLEAGLQAAQDLGLTEIKNMKTVSNLAEVQRALHRYGCVFAGMIIDDGWGHAQPDGFIPPGKNDIGGHAILLCAYDANGGWVGLQNSWGAVQGWRGFNRLRENDFARQFDYGLIWTD